MIARLWNLLVGQFCKHTWEVLEQCDLYRSEKATMSHGTRWSLRCTKCGNIKSKRT